MKTMKTKKFILEISEEQKDLLILALSNMQIAMFNELMEEEKNSLIYSHIVEWDKQMPYQQEKTLRELQEESLTQPSWCFREAQGLKDLLMKISCNELKNPNPN